MKNSIICIMLFFFISLDLNAQSKVDRHYQFQLNASGLFLFSFGNYLADSEVEDLQLKDGLLPGVSVGYHFNKKYYLGYSYQPNKNLVRTGKWTFSDGGNDGRIELDHNTGEFHTLEFRWSPFKPGFYASLFATHITKGNYIMDFTRLDSTMHLGTKDYASDVTANWNYKKINTLGLGIGYNHITNYAISFGLGLGIPITINETFHQNISLESKQGITFAQLDENNGINKIRDEQFYYPIQLYFNVGFNLKRLFTKRNPFR